MLFQCHGLAKQLFFLSFLSTSQIPKFKHFIYQQPRPVLTRMHFLVATYIYTPICPFSNGACLQCIYLILSSCFARFLVLFFSYSHPPFFFRVSSPFLPSLQEWSQDCCNDFAFLVKWQRTPPFRRQKGAYMPP